MIQFLLATAFAAPLAPQDIPNPRARGGWVTDLADQLSPDAEARINARIDAMHADLGPEIALVTVSAVDDDPKAFATRLFNTWGIGDSAAHDGVLVLLVTDARRVEIEVGYGLEGALPDSAVGRILDTAVIPRFKQGDIEGGLEAAILSLDQRLRGQPDEIVAMDRSAASAAQGPLPPVGLGLLVGGMATVGGAFWVKRRRLRRCPVCKKEMTLLDEQAEDAHLDAGQQAEERLDSIDYEVRVCTEHQQLRIFPHTRWLARRRACPSCNYRTAQSDRSTLSHATYDQGGEVAITVTCPHCGHHSQRILHTAPLPHPGADTSSGGSCFGGSSSGGGSFGGGSSGGGGAGRSW
jgi:uncharacterized protein